MNRISYRNIVSPKSLSLKSIFTRLISTEIDFAEARPFEEIPGPPSTPLLKGIPWFSNFGGYGVEDSPSLFRDYYYKYGPIWKPPSLPMKDRQTVTIYSPESVRKVFQNEGKMPERDILRCVAEYRRRNPQVYKSAGVVVENGKVWSELRSQLQPVMMRLTDLNPYLPSVDSIAVEFRESLAESRKGNRTTLSFFDQASNWALESVCSISLDTHLGCLKKDLDEDSEAYKLVSCTKVFLESISKLETTIPLYKLYDTSNWTTFSKAQQVVEDIGQKHLTEIEKMGATGTEGRQYFMKTLGLDYYASIVLLLDMLIAGIDTTASSLTFYAYNLATNPDYQEQLYQEIKGVLPDMKSPITYNEIHQLHLLKAGLRETHRLYPSFNVLFRKLPTDLVLDGYLVPKGTVCLLAMGATSRLEEYFKDADSFRPERWLRGRSDLPRSDRYGSLPWGHGARMCLGKNIAEVEIWMAIIRILQKYRLEYHGEAPRAISHTVLVPDRPLYFDLINRDQ